MKKIALIMGLVGLVLLSMSTQQFANSVRGFPSSCTGPQDNTLKWSKQIDNKYTNLSLTVGEDGTIYLWSYAFPRALKSEIYAIDSNGEIKWIYSDAGTVVEGPPFFDKDGVIYFGSCDSHVYALNPDGTLKWSYDVGKEVTYSVVDENGIVYFGSFDYHLYALNPDGTLKKGYPLENIGGYLTLGSDGNIYSRVLDNIYALDLDRTIRWSFHTHGLVIFTPTIDKNGTVYFGTWGENFYALNPDGTLRWIFHVGSYVTCPPVIAEDNIIYFGSWNENFYALNPDGTLKWYFETGARIRYPSKIGSDGTIYVIPDGEHFYALNPDGTLEWVFPAKISFPVIDTNGIIYFGANDGNFYALNPDGSVKWQYAAGGEPTLASLAPDGTIYFISGSALYAIGPPLEQPLPTWLSVTFIVIPLLALLGAFLYYRRK